MRRCCTGRRRRVCGPAASAADRGEGRLLQAGSRRGSRRNGAQRGPTGPRGAGGSRGGGPGLGPAACPLPGPERAVAPGEEAGRCRLEGSGGALRLGPAWHGSALLGPARFGPARSAPVSRRDPWGPRLRAVGRGRLQTLLLLSSFFAPSACNHIDLGICWARGSTPGSLLVLFSSFLPLTALVGNPPPPLLLPHLLCAPSSQT